jgi:hypothetical protein
MKEKEKISKSLVDEIPLNFVEGRIRKDSVSQLILRTNERPDRRVEFALSDNGERQALQVFVING